MKYFDRNSVEITEVQWAVLQCDEHYRRVGYTEFEDGTNVSTIWMGTGIGHAQGRPYIFETLVFDANDESENGERYQWVDDATRGHANYVMATGLKKDRVLSPSELYESVRTALSS